MAPLAPLQPVVLEGHGVRLEPLRLDHAPELEHCAADGELWRLRFTSAPAPGQAAAYVEAALRGAAEQHMLPFVVRDLGRGGDVVGTTRYHDILLATRRVEIGYTWYALSAQRTHVNTACKLLLLTHAFNTLGCLVVGWRTDNFNFASQRAIERLGARRDGIIRGNALRRDGTLRDTVMYSLAAGEWPQSRAHLRWRLAQAAR
ncbi:GNAT family N-acetyltransferase [Verticiella sediminum]|uniref:GNAT family N-acetyltransferase n=1 Tax=Verticiella sediminum TaxID=1247510 RepID=A0A556AU26_9BURK|nr:GNAT family protein [Verticiella sediminum]TSH96458.1 GNAT family N-acetyltransferase [Verticiella sediminum]